MGPRQQAICGTSAEASSFWLLSLRRGHRNWPPGDHVVDFIPRYRPVRTRRSGEGQRESLGLPGLAHDEGAESEDGCVNGGDDGG